MNSIRDEAANQIAVLTGIPRNEINDEMFLFGDLQMELQDIKNILTILGKKFGSEINLESVEMQKLTIGNLALMLEEGQE
jgi:hypothetical protein